MTAIRVATRGSDLALAQARFVASRLRDVLGLETELMVIKTTGDRVQRVPLSEIGGKGLFVKEIEEALLDGSADVAVHSAKDLPAGLAPGLELVAFPERADPRDALVGRSPTDTLLGLGEGARVGTGSVRRAALLRAVRPDLDIVPLRGNVPTRLQKIDTESLDAVVLACAGLDRLDLGARISERLPPETVLPAVCQGTLALEARAGDVVWRDLARLDDPATAIRAGAERAFLAEIEGDCKVPVAAYCESPSDERVRMRGLVASVDGQRIVRAESDVPVSKAADAGRDLAREVLEAGGREILDAARAGGGA